MSHRKWIAGKDMDKEFETELADYICKVEKREKFTSTSIINVLMRNGIYTYEDLKEAIEHSKKKVWYQEITNCGKDRAIILENFCRYKDGEARVIEDEEIRELKAQIRELQAQLREKQKKTVNFGDAWSGVQRYSTTRPDEYYIAVSKEGVEYDQKTKTSVKIVVSNSKERAIVRLGALIFDLKGLYNKLTEEEDNRN